MRGININFRNRKLLYSIFAVALVSIFTLTIAYAALSVTLNIAGSAEIVASSWDIYLDNVKVTGGSASGTSPTITGGTTATFSTTLTTPGEFYEFTIDVVNNGTIDAMINSINKSPTLTTTQAKYLKYEITYQNGDSISTKQLVQKNSFVRLKVRVEYRKDLVASDLPNTSETLNLAFTVNYVQSDTNGTNISNNGIYVDSSYPFGKEVCFNKECFYVISSTKDTVTLLAKMNVTLEDKPKQSATAAVTPYSNVGNDYLNSIVRRYVINYKNVIEQDYNIGVIEARLMTFEELADPDTFACEEWGVCSDRYPWIYSVPFWTSSVLEVDDSYIWDINEFYAFRGDYYGSEICGVRPVIVVSKDNLN